MSNYGWTNADGEPIMDGAAYRFEQQLDAESMFERHYDEYYGDDGYDGECEDESHECDSCERASDTGVWTCSYCDRPCDPKVHEESDAYYAEDAWLDGSYEE